MSVVTMMISLRHVSCIPPNISTYKPESLVDECNIWSENKVKNVVQQTRHRGNK